MHNNEAALSKNTGEITGPVLEYSHSAKHREGTRDGDGARRPAHLRTCSPRVLLVRGEEYLCPIALAGCLMGGLEQF